MAAIVATLFVMGLVAAIAAFGAYVILRSPPKKKRAH